MIFSQQKQYGRPHEKGLFLTETVRPNVQCKHYAKIIDVFNFYQLSIGMMKYFS